MACDDICNLIDSTKYGNNAVVGYQSGSLWAASMRKRRTRRCMPKQRPIRKQPPLWKQLRSAHALAGLPTADYRGISQIIIRACREVVGTCWHRKTLTPFDRSRIHGLVAERVRAAGIRVCPTALAGRTAFWLRAHDPAKALWYSIHDVARLVQVISSRISLSELHRINEEHRNQLDGRVIDYFTIAVVGVTVAKNSLVENGKTKREECGTKALIGMLKSVGVNANGTLIRLCREILVGLDLIRCTDARYFTKGMYGPGQCQKWVPCGAMWGLPFLSEIRPEELTEAQRAEFDRYHASRQQQPAQPSDDHSHSMMAVVVETIYYSYPVSTYPTQSYTPIPVSDDGPDPDSDEFLVTDYGTTAPIVSVHEGYSYDPSTPCDHEQDDSAPAPALLPVDAATNDWDGSVWDEV